MYSFIAALNVKKDILYKILDKDCVWFTLYNNNR